MTFIRSILTGLTCLILLSAAADTPKTALLVAISAYPASGGWQALNAENDVIIIREALIKQGFREDEIVVLKDQQATRAGILSAIRTHLVGKARPGGIACFHFSGHGQQVYDNDGEELDGFDEAIVPIDSPLEYDENGYKGENLIRDDELRDLFNEVRAKLGPRGSMQVILDACHSGTGTRGFGVARGTTVKMAPPEYRPAGQSRGSGQASMDAFGIQESADLAPMVAFFGAAHNQLNFETVDEAGRNVGSLSYAFSKKFAAATPSTTYRGLFEQVKLEMSAIAPRQTPQAEGTLDQVIMGGEILGAPVYFKVDRWNDPGSVNLDAGWLQGVHEGCRIAFYPPETRDLENARPLAVGEVTRSEAVFSTVILDEGNELDDIAAKSSWAFVTRKSFGKLHVKFRSELPENSPVLPYLRKRLEGMPIEEVDQGAEVILLPDDGGARGGSGVKVVTSNDIQVNAYPASQRPEMVADRILKDFIAHAQARFLKNLELKSHQISLDLDVVPVEYDRRTGSSRREIPLSEKTDGAGSVNLRVGDVFKVRVTNNGYKPAYFTLVDIQPDNVVNILIPDAGETPDEFVVPPGKTWEVPRLFQIGEPYGMEVFKLIATDEPVDLRPISSTRGSGGSGRDNPVEQLFGQTYFNEDCQTRGGRTLAISASELHIDSFTFIIGK